MNWKEKLRRKLSPTDEEKVEDLKKQLEVEKLKAELAKTRGEQGKSERPPVPSFLRL